MAFKTNKMSINSANKILPFCLNCGEVNLIRFDIAIFIKIAY